MLANMTYEAFAEWQQYAREEPFGEWRADLRIGQLCAIVANLFRNDKKRPEPYKATDFMLFAEKPEAQEKRDILAPETRAWLLMMAAKTTAEKAQNGQ